MTNIFKRIMLFKICERKINYSKLNPRNFKWSSFKKIIKGLAIFIIFLGALIIVKDEITYQLGLFGFQDDESGYLDETAEEDAQEPEENCNVLGIELHGDLSTYIPPSDSDEADGSDESAGDQTASEDIVYAVRQAEDDDSIKAIILEVDSYGGYPVAGEEVANAFKKAKKPTVALIREGAASAAYMAASGADKIFASKSSDVGSIAVTMSYLDYVKQNQKEGVTYVPLISGKFKDTGDPNKSLSPEEKNLLMRDVNILHQNFVKMIAENRNMDIEKVEKLADGSTMLGEMALQNGLVDQIGGISEVEEYLKEKIGEEVEVCW